MPIRYGPQTVAALLLEDARQSRRQRRQEKQQQPQQPQQQQQQPQQQQQQQQQPQPQPQQQQADAKEAGSGVGPAIALKVERWGAFSGGRVGRVQEVADRVLGTALKDTLISDDVRAS